MNRILIIVFEYNLRNRIAMDESIDAAKPASGGGPKKNNASGGKSQQKGKGKGKKEDLDYDAEARSYFGCRFRPDEKNKNCSICKLQVEAPERFTAKRQRPLMALLKSETVKNIGFRQLIDCLLPHSLELEGCEVLFPDSVFFGEDGKPAFIARTDREGKLYSVWQPSKLGLQDIR